jgi:hypothetical protein
MAGRKCSEKNYLCKKQNGERGYLSQLRLIFGGVNKERLFNYKIKTLLTQRNS